MKYVYHINTFIFFIIMNDHVKHLVIYWESKELTAIAIYQKCCKNFGENAVAYSTITDWCRKIKRGENILQRKIGSGISQDNYVDQKILLELEQMPFHSVRSLSTVLKIPKSTIFDHLHKMGFIVKHLRFVPHILSPSQKVQRMNLSKQLLQVIKQARHQSWKYFLTGDESWFFFLEDYEIQWLKPDQKPSTKTRRIIASPKRMLTVFWSPIGFRIVEMLPHGEKFNADYFINCILKKIVDSNPKQSSNSSKRRVVLHMDNATPHRAKATQNFAQKNGLAFSPHPAFSPDLAPSDFYLFGKVKDAIKGMEFESEEDLLDEVIKVLSQISREELESVMDEWEQRLLACIANGGDYVE